MSGHDRLIALALEEDAALGDLTSRAIFPSSHRSRGSIVAREPLVVCGLDVAVRVFEMVDGRLKTRLLTEDGDRVAAGAAVLRVQGPTVGLLTAERTALNFLQRLSGVATMARRYADAVKETDVRVVDTRKTTPGWRALERHAVRCGGCFNHRSSLGEHVLIKDNHLAAAGSIARAVERCRRQAPHVARIEVEAATLAQVRDALRARADVILLDNMSVAQARSAVALIAGRAIVEVSGRVTLDTIGDYARAGADVISVGALTHSAPAVDIGLDLRPRRSR